ncbi:MAG: LysR family transcriptional regulator [Proteobacteria bacterium]|nr:LysR family transcriptional regulator [Pseudomonadota bacterium]
MKATLSQIEAFYWITRLGSFRAAAMQLNLTQPTVSLRIHNLEESLGVRLFKRAGRKMRLTDDGTTLLPDVGSMMQLAGQISARQRLVDPLHGRLRLGAPASIALGCMAELLGTLEKRDARFDVALTIEKSSILQRRLNEREIDVAIVVEPDVKPHVRVAPLGIMKHAWFASPRLSLARRWIGPADLMPHQVFTQPEPSNLMTLVMTWFGSAGLEPKRLGTCDSISVIARLTAAGEGVSILSPAILGTELCLGKVEMLKTRPTLVRPRLYLAYQADKVGHGMKLVIQAIRDCVIGSSLLARR